jgi:hypothetical protein
MTLFRLLWAVPPRTRFWTSTSRSWWRATSQCAYQLYRDRSQHRLRWIRRGRRIHDLRKGAGSANNPDHVQESPGSRGQHVDFDGKTGWIKTPRGLFSLFQLEGGELDGARLEGQLAFPGKIKSYLRNWRTGLRRAIDDKDYLIVQGSGPRGLLATFYFDEENGYLRRLVRYTPSPVGRVSGTGRLFRLSGCRWDQVSVRTPVHVVGWTIYSEDQRHQNECCGRGCEVRKTVNK